MRIARLESPRPDALPAALSALLDRDIPLPEEAATLAFGALLAPLLAGLVPLPLVFLEGDLGAGKTTLTRGLVSALPGGDLAQTASPSFSLVNRYPTTPPTAHMDFYRLGGAGLDEELDDALGDESTLRLVEWPAWSGVEAALTIRLARV